MTITKVSGFHVISNPDGDCSESVLVPEHNDATRTRAARVIVQNHAEPWDETTEAAAVEMLAATATAVSFTQHTSEPTDEQGCGCEGVGWWCESPGNGGVTRDFWNFEWDDIEDARELAESLPENEESN